MHRLIRRPHLIVLVVALSPGVVHAAEAPVDAPASVALFSPVVSPEVPCSPSSEFGCGIQLLAAAGAAVFFAAASAALTIAILDGVPGDELVMLEAEALAAALVFAAADAALNACLA